MRCHHLWDKHHIVFKCCSVIIKSNRKTYLRKYSFNYPSKSKLILFLISFRRISCHLKEFCLKLMVHFSQSTWKHFLGNKETKVVSTVWNKLKPWNNCGLCTDYGAVQIILQCIATTQHFQLYSLSLLERIAYRLLHTAPIKHSWQQLGRDAHINFTLFLR